MSRAEWTFTVPANELGRACSDRAAYHNTRLQWWRVEREKAEARVVALGKEGA